MSERLSTAGPAGGGEPAVSTETADSERGLAELRRDLWRALAALIGVLVIVGIAWSSAMSGLAPRKKAPAEPLGPSDAPPTPPAPPAEPGVLSIVRVASLGPDDPDAPFWDRAPATAVDFQPQTLTSPQMPDVSVKRALLEAATDGERTALRVTWKDPSADANVDTRRFSDAVAIGFPLDENAPPMMGAKGLRLQILFWKALWQKDLDEHFQDVQDLHPNFWSDLYWFAEGKFPYPIPQAFRRPESRQWFPAQQAGNAMASFEREQPVQELLAEGWGTLTPQRESVTTARGAWRDGHWSVVFSRPTRTADPLDAPLDRPEGQVALAVWNGAAGNRGGRKQWAGWIKTRLATGEPPPAPTKLRTHLVSVLPADDPAAPAWAEAPSLAVELVPQQLTTPQQQTRTIAYLRARALTDGQRLSVRVTWRDPRPDYHVDTGRFCDAVAVGFPIDENAPPMMGAKGYRMQLLYWKALWQKDVDEGFQDVQDLYPNYWSDLYWFAEGEFPYRIPGAFQRAESRLYFPAQQAGNPVSTFDRKTPVQELLAEGWGTLTHQKVSVSTGRGVWRNGRWSVVFTRPLRTDDPQDAQLSTDSKNRKIAFAVWDGAAGDRGARKNWSATWVDFEIEVSE
ncbi:MAG: ethylbenzene dehydrogenase-related protein [Planctomycetota bacterium]